MAKERKFGRRNRLVIHIFAIMSCLCGPLAIATEDVDDFFAMSPLELANIPISIATGTEKPVYQSAAVTTVITAEQIKTMGATKLSQVLETVPGLHVTIQAVTNDPSYSMRGIFNSVNNQILVLLNGTRFSVPYKGSPMSGMQLPVEAIQRIEVIRGPGSALYGADAFAGVINIITKKAQDIAGTEIGVRGGSWDAQSIWGLHGDQWSGWEIAATVQYSHQNNDEDRVINADAQTGFDSAFATSASNTPGEMQTNAETWNAHLNLSRQHWQAGFWAFNSVDAGLRAGAGGALDDKGKLNGEHYLGDLQYSTEDDLQDWELNARMNYLYTNIDANFYNFPVGTRLPIDGVGNINPVSPVIISSFPAGMRTHLGIENQVVGFEVSSLYKGFEKHLLRSSIAYRYEKVKTREQRNYGRGILNGTQAVVNGELTNVTATDLVFLPDSSRSIWSVALQDEWQIMADWLFTAGIRYDEYSDFGHTFNPRFALVWDINDKLSSKLLYGQAFRAPSFLEQKQQNSQLFLGTPNLEPETIETVELAFDYRPYDDLRFAVNFYYYEIENLIGINANSGSVAKTANLTGQTGFGSEFEWDWQISEQLNLRGNYAWQYARNKDTKSRVAGVPEHQVYVAVAWSFLPQWKIQTQFNWVGHRLNLTTGPNNNELKDYGTVDMTLNSQQFFNHLDFSASVRNVFDEDGKEPAISAYPENLPIPSRSFYFEANLRF